MYKREWSGDWNGRGEPLVDAMADAAKATGLKDFRFEADIAWNLRGVRARYLVMQEARERLGYSAPPKWVTLRLWHPLPADQAKKREVPWFDEPEDPTDLEVIVKVTETQVGVAAHGDQMATVISTFRAARKVIESHAVTKVPYHMRDNQPVESSRWTRTVVWIERHPALAAIIAALIAAVATLVTAFIS